MLYYVRTIVGLFKGKPKAQGKVCPNGHVMHPSWSTCPYCAEAAAQAAGQPNMPPSGATAMININDLGGGDGDKKKKGPVVGWVVALNGAHNGEDFRLHPGKNTVGTAADADIVLTDKKISRKHAVIRYEGGQFVLNDLDSSNGTFVNDEKVAKQELIDNDTLRFGDIEFEFKCRANRERRD